METQKDQVSKSEQPDRPARDADKDNEHGEGNYKASREFNDNEARWVGEGKVEEAAKNAAPRSAAEAKELEDAEAEARSHAKDAGPQPQVRDGQVVARNRRCDRFKLTQSRRGGA